MNVGGNQLLLENELHHVWDSLADEVQLSDDRPFHINGAYDSQQIDYVVIRNPRGSVAVEDRDVNDLHVLGREPVKYVVELLGENQPGQRFRQQIADLTFIDDKMHVRRYCSAKWNSFS